jgi:hypothetical protein
MATWFRLRFRPAGQLLLNPGGDSWVAREKWFGIHYQEHMVESYEKLYAALLTEKGLWASPAGCK